MADRDTHHALRGLKVLDLAALFPAPLLAAMLGDFGADVVKVEPLRGDGLRRVATSSPDGQSTAWALAGRNKRSIALDDSQFGDLATLAALTNVADVIIVNQPISKLRHWRCTPEEIATRNPRAIVVSLTAFGTVGPMADVGGNGSIAEAFAGFAELNGSPEGPPTLPSLALGDTLAAISALNGVLAALYWRDALGGSGQFIDATIYEPILAIESTVFASWQPAQSSPTRNGSQLANAAPRNVYCTRDDRWIAISATTDAQVARVLQLIDHHDDQRFARAEQRVGGAARELDRMVAAWVVQRDVDEVEAALMQERIPVARVNSLREVAQHPHVVARRSLSPLVQGSQSLVPAPIPWMTVSPPQFQGPAPSLGVDGTDILRDWLDIVATPFCETDSA